MNLEQNPNYYPENIHRRSETGQSLILIAFAFVALLVVIGLAIDLGLMYIERVKLGKACDAAALAAAQDLPFEEYATRRAMEYLEKNGYGPQNVTLDVQAHRNNTYEAKLEQEWNSQNGPNVVGTVAINTVDFRVKVSGKEQPADKIRVSGTVNVPMNFMRFIGFTSVPVSASATAENVSNLDIALVFDESGSMIFDTRCFGCYEQYINRSTGEYTPYPVGIRRYLPLPTWLSNPQPAVSYGGHPILTQEAEYFFNATSYGGAHDYHYAVYERGNTFWTLQRVANSHASGYSSESGDGRGAHMMHNPQDSDALSGYSTMAAAQARAPRLDYAFDLPNAGTWYVWLRAQCGRDKPSGSTTGSCIAYWGVDGTALGGTNASMFKSGYTDNNYDEYANYKVGFDTRYPWRWVRAGSFTASAPGVKHINIWGGGLGFKLDKILLTTNPNSTPVSGVKDNAPDFIVNTTTTPGMSGITTWNNVKNKPAGSYLTYEYNGQYGGPPDSGNRAAIKAKDSRIKIDFAVYPCNPNYGLVYHADWDGDGQIEPHESCDNRNDDLFDDVQPIRFAKVAAQNFVKRLNARFDQISFTKYSNSGQIIRELACILTPARGTDRMPEGYEGVWNPQTGPDPAWLWCYDHKASGDGLSGYPADDVTHGSVIWGIEKMYPDAGTNMAEGMREGIKTLSTDTGHYGRPNATKVMLLMTDGVANVVPGGSDPCKSSNGWPDSGTGTAKDCVIYYADEAYKNGIVVFTIGLGGGADHAILKEVADRTGGVYYYAPGGEQLDAVFQQIADQILLRLVD